MSGFSRINRICTRQIHADEPICANTAKPGFIQTIEIFVVTQGRKCPFQRFIVLRIDQNTPDFTLVMQKIQNLINQKLPFPVGIPRMNNHIGLFD